MAEDKDNPMIAGLPADCVMQKRSKAQVENIQKFLTWVKTCPYDFTVSSMSSGNVYVKFDMESNDA
jgi:hypothetical protein